MGSGDLNWGAGACAASTLTQWVTSVFSIINEASLPGMGVGSRDDPESAKAETRQCHLCQQWVGVFQRLASCFTFLPHLNLWPGDLYNKNQFYQLRKRVQGQGLEEGFVMSRRTESIGGGHGAAFVGICSVHCRTRARMVLRAVGGFRWRLVLNRITRAFPRH